jgi:single-strand DNA-binding protein
VSDLNLVALTGRIGKDPEIRYTGGGTAVANTRMAVSRRRKGKDGERQDDTTWVTLVFWDKLAELVSNYVSKGSQIAVRGELQVRQWDDKTTGAKREATEVRVHDLTLLGGRGTSSQASVPEGGMAPAMDDFQDDDIPF